MKKETLGKQKKKGRPKGKKITKGKIITGHLPLSQHEFINRFVRLHPLQASNAIAVVRIALDYFQKKIEGETWKQNVNRQN